MRLLYKVHKGRKVPKIPFQEIPINEFRDLLNKTAIYDFFKNFKNKGGIYKFTLKNKPNIFYIGSTVNLYNRFKQHTKPDALAFNYDIFHVSASNFGWDKFYFEVLEIESDLFALRNKENILLQKYYPLLNQRYKASVTPLRKEKLLLAKWKENRAIANKEIDAIKTELATGFTPEIFDEFYKEETKYLSSKGNTPIFNDSSPKKPKNKK